MKCADILEQELLEKYLACGLTEDEQAAVELHFFECAKCFGELETLRALRQELSRLPQPRPAAAAVPFLRRKSAWALAAAAALVVAALLLWGPGPKAPTPAGPPATGTAPVVKAPEATPSAGHPARVVPQEKLARLRELARIEPPAYEPAELRGPEDEAQRLFRQVMRHYQQHDYAAAIPGLRQAAAKDPEAANVAFFLGACDLLTGRTDAGIRRLRQVAALGDSPYLEESHLLLAKAHLQKQDVAGAKAELQQVIGLKGDFQNEGEQLLKRLEELN